MEFTYEIGTLTVNADSREEADKAACDVLSDMLFNNDIVPDVSDAD
jgi:hypothetical protein